MKLFVDYMNSCVEVTEQEAKEWGDAHKLYGAARESCISHILKNTLGNETFAEASARLDYGNCMSDKSKQYYYDRYNVILGE